MDDFDDEAPTLEPDRDPERLELAPAELELVHLRRRAEESDR